MDRRGSAGHVTGCAFRLRDWFAVRSKTLYVQRYGFRHQSLHLFGIVAGCYAPREIGREGRIGFPELSITTRYSLMTDGSPSGPPAEGCYQRASFQILPKLTRHRDRSGFGGMMKLSDTHPASHARRCAGGTRRPRSHPSFPDTQSRSGPKRQRDGSRPQTRVSSVRGGRLGIRTRIR